MNRSIIGNMKQFGPIFFLFAALALHSSNLVAAFEECMCECARECPFDGYKMACDRPMSACTSTCEFFPECGGGGSLIPESRSSNYDSRFSNNEYMNVYGNTLQSCSQEGMALTGWTRSGECVEEDDDTGSHHICIDLSSTTGGDFCTVTGQSDWCSSEMPCHEDDDYDCPVEQWCVCQWAFADYIENAGGCDQIQEIICEATNMEAWEAYRDTPGYEDALECLEERCGLSSGSLVQTEGSNAGGETGRSFNGGNGGGFLGGAGGGGGGNGGGNGGNGGGFFGGGGGGGGNGGGNGGNGGGFFGGGGGGGGNGGGNGGNGGGFFGGGGGGGGNGGNGGGFFGGGGGGNGNCGGGGGGIFGGGGGGCSPAAYPRGSTGMAWSLLGLAMISMTMLGVVA